MERTVYAALIVAGKPVTNDELARLMRVSKGEASKRVTALNGRVSKVRHVAVEQQRARPFIPAAQLARRRRSLYEVIGSDGNPYRLLGHRPWEWYAHSGRALSYRGVQQCPSFKNCSLQSEPS